MPPDASPALNTTDSRRESVPAFAVCAALCALIVALRILWPASNPYSRLDWSSGLLTDEGFYLHNARNFVLFGRERTDAFNNALLSPTLHAAQIAVFRQFGAGMAQARSISIAAGLLTLPLFFAALRRAYDVRTAALATVFLGLDHVPLLYGRMALMDTPAALIFVGAFYCWSRVPLLPASESKRTARLWLFCCGALLGLAFVTRGLCAFLIPIPLLIIGLQARKRRGREEWIRLLAFIFGLGFVLLLYVCLWAAPHRAELAQANSFYLRQQLLPRSLPHFARIVTRSFFGETRGLAPALAAHTPVLFALSLAGLLWRFRVWREFPPLSENSLFLGGWLLSGWITFSVIGYAPSRYYVLFFPALAAVAALACRRLPEILRFLLIPDATRVLFGSFFAYHFALLASPFDELHKILFAGGFTLCAALLLRFLPKKIKGRIPSAQAAFRLIFTCWLLIDGLWLCDWIRHLSYSQQNAEHWLIKNLPPDAVLLGDAAPGLSVDSRFVSVPVIPGLCNTGAPGDRLPGQTYAIIILDGDRRETWWDKNYPALVAPQRLAAFFPDIAGFPVGIYLAPPEVRRKNKPPT